jgi:hypothetical protein
MQSQRESSGKSTPLLAATRQHLWQYSLPLCIIIERDIASYRFVSTGLYKELRGLFSLKIVLTNNSALTNEIHWGKTPHTASRVKSWFVARDERWQLR